MNRRQVPRGDTQNRVGSLSNLSAGLTEMTGFYIRSSMNDAGDVNRRFFGVASLAQHRWLPSYDNPVPTMRNQASRTAAGATHTAAVQLWRAFVFFCPIFVLVVTLLWMNQWTDSQLLREYAERR